MQLANDAGFIDTRVVGGPGRIRRRRRTVTRRGVRPSPRTLTLQAGMAIGQVSPDSSRILRKESGLGRAVENEMVANSAGR